MANQTVVFDLQTLGEFATVLVDADGEYVCLYNGRSHIPLRLVSGSLLRGAVTLDLVIDDANATAQLQTLLRFRSLRERGRFGAWLHRPEARARQWIRQLRAFDGLSAGANDREIAAELFGRRRAEKEWRDRDGSMRSAVRRLVAIARRNVAGGYRDLLRAK